MDIYSLLALLFSLLYIVFAVKNSKWCFPFAFVGSLIWAFADFSIYNLKFDGGLQIFYAIMAIIGWLKWGSADTNTKANQQIQSIPLVKNIIIIAVGLSSTFFLVELLNHFTSTNLPFLDAGTTVFSVFATFMLIYRKIDNWIYLLICDLLYIYIYYAQGAYFFVVVMVIYSILAVIGFYSWLKYSKEEVFE